MRHKLISESRLSKYLLYAIGEIVLVVIGILIALAINNKNQSLVDRKKEQIYLKGLREEFQTSKLKLTELIRVNRTNYQIAQEIIESLSKDTITITEKQFSEALVNSISADVAFNPNNSLLIEMINSGSLKDITNTTLRILLTNWMSTLEDIGKQEDELAYQREKVLNMLRAENVSLRGILDLSGVSKGLGISQSRKTSTNLDLLNSKEFENNILIFLITAYATETAHYQPLMEELDAILQSIASEIED